MQSYYAEVKGIAWADFLDPESVVIEPQQRTIRAGDVDEALRLASEWAKEVGPAGGAIALRYLPVRALKVVVFNIEHPAERAEDGVFIDKNA